MNGSAPADLRGSCLKSILMGNLLGKRSLTILALCASLSFIVSGCAQDPPGPSSTAGPGSLTPVPEGTPTETPKPSSTPDPSEPVPDPAAEPSSVRLEIISAAYDEANNVVSGTAMVTDRVSDAGTCTLTVSQGEQAVTTSAAGMADASVTYCADLSVALPADASGMWTATVAFDEPGYHGEANSEVVVP